MAAIGIGCLSATVHARDIPKGTLELFGDLDISVVSQEVKIRDGFSQDTVDTDTNTISLSALYYVDTNLGIGILWDYESAKSSSGGVTAKTTTHVIGPGALMNISMNDKASLFLLGGFGFASIDYNDSIFGAESADGFGYQFGGGIRYFVNDNVSFNSSVRYLSLTVDIDGSGEEIESTGISIGVGLSVFFN